MEYVRTKKIAAHDALNYEEIYSLRKNQKVPTEEENVSEEDTREVDQ